MDSGVAVFFVLSGFLIYRPFVAAQVAGRPDPARAAASGGGGCCASCPAYWVALTFFWALGAFTLGSRVVAVLPVPADLLPLHGARRHGPGLEPLHGDDLLPADPAVGRGRSAGSSPGGSVRGRVRWTLAGCAGLWLGGVGVADRHRALGAEPPRACRSTGCPPTSTCSPPAWPWPSCRCGPPTTTALRARLDRVARSVPAVVGWRRPPSSSGTPTGSVRPTSFDRATRLVLAPPPDHPRRVHPAPAGAGGVRRPGPGAAAPGLVVAGHRLGGHRVLRPLPLALRLDEALDRQPRRRSERRLAGLGPHPAPGQQLPVPARGRAAHGHAVRCRARWYLLELPLQRFKGACAAARQAGSSSVARRARSRRSDLTVRSTTPAWGRWGTADQGRHLRRALVIGVVLRFVTRSPLWLDEALSVNIARLPLGDIPEALRHDGHPPLYYFLLHGWMDAVRRGRRRGAGAVGRVRAWRPSRCCGSPARASAAPGWPGTRSAVRGRSRPTPSATRTETRMYSLVMLLVLAGWLLARRLPPPPRPGPAGRASPCSSALLLLDPLLGDVAARRRRHRRCSCAAVPGPPGGPADDVRATRAACSLAMVAGGVLFLPWLPTCSTRAPTPAPRGPARSGPPRWSRSPLADLGGGGQAEAIVLGWFVGRLVLLGPDRSRPSAAPASSSTCAPGREARPVRHRSIVGTLAVGTAGRLRHRRHLRQPLRRRLRPVPRAPRRPGPRPAAQPARSSLVALRRAARPRRRRRRAATSPSTASDARRSAEAIEAAGRRRAWSSTAPTSSARRPRGSWATQFDQVTYPRVQPPASASTGSTTRSGSTDADARRVRRRAARPGRRPPDLPRVQHRATSPTRTRARRCSTPSARQRSPEVLTEHHRGLGAGRRGAVHRRRTA